MCDRAPPGARLGRRIFGFGGHYELRCANHGWFFEKSDDGWEVSVCGCSWSCKLKRGKEREREREQEEEEEEEKEEKSGKTRKMTVLGFKGRDGPPLKK